MIRIKDLSSRASRKLIFVLKNVGRYLLRNKANKKHISGNGIAMLCDINITNLERDYSNEITGAYLVFVKSEYLEECLYKYGKKFEKKIIVAGNSDKNFIKRIPEMDIPDKIYLQNLGFPADDRIGLLPIGLENYEHVRSGFAFLHREPRRFRIKNRVLVPPMSATNPIRSRVLSEIDNYPIFEKKLKYVNVLRYFNLARKYEYILVCEGNGFDTHRLWEVLYQGSKPVVFKSEFTSNLERLGLPVLVIENLSEVSLQLINDHRTKHQLYVKEKLGEIWLDYWRTTILAKTKNENLQS